MPFSGQCGDPLALADEEKLTEVYACALGTRRCHPKMPGRCFFVKKKRVYRYKDLGG